MTGIRNDSLIADLVQFFEIIHQVGRKIATKINHGGMHRNERVIAEWIAPSEITSQPSKRIAREMTKVDIEELVDACAQSARRVAEYNLKSPSANTALLLSRLLF